MNKQRKVDSAFSCVDNGRLVEDEIEDPLADSLSDNEEETETRAYLSGEGRTTCLARRLERFSSGAPATLVLRLPTSVQAACSASTGNFRATR